MHENANMRDNDTAENNNMGDIVCKICLERDPEETLVSNICACKGTMGTVHLECIDRWRIHFPPSHPKYSTCPDCRETFRRVDGMMPLESTTASSSGDRTLNVICMSGLVGINGSWMVLTWGLDTNFTTMFPMTLLCHVFNCVAMCNSNRLLPFPNEGNSNVGYSLCALGIWVMVNVWHSWLIMIPAEIIGLLLYWMKLLFSSIPDPPQDGYTTVE